MIDIRPAADRRDGLPHRAVTHRASRAPRRALIIAYLAAHLIRRRAASRYGTLARPDEGPDTAPARFTITCPPLRRDELDPFMASSHALTAI